MELTTSRARYTVDDFHRNTYYQLPKFLFNDEFIELSNDAKILYALLKDRHELSVKNGWVNDKGEVYLIFSRENMCKALRLSDKPVTKAMNDLKKMGLVDEQRRGLGKPNLIYLLIPANLDFTKTRRRDGSKNGVNLGLNSVDFPTSQTNIKEINYSLTESQSQSQSQELRNLEKVERMKEKIKDRVEEQVKIEKSENQIDQL